MCSQKDRYIDWLEHRIDYYGRYHDHKETMAWVATAFYLTGIMYFAFTSLHTFEGSCANHVLLSLLFALSGYLVFCFVKWQFERRWKAHEKVATLQNMLELAVYSADEKFNAPKFEIRAIPRGCKQKRKALEHLLPWRLCNKANQFDNELQPLKSELITYIAITLVTVVAIIIVCIN